MKRYLLLIPVLLPIYLFAGLLSPQTEAPLFDHLTEVNPHIINHIDPDLTNKSPISFENDIERIQAHLSFVEQYLRSHQPEGLTEEQIALRMQSLDNLNRYWKNGEFPMNNYHMNQQPYFIDDRGVACAVGQLMVESGYADVAENIRKENNYGYVRDLSYQYPELGIWGSLHGFTEAELAWIQPAYSPMVNWDMLGTGPNGEVDVLVEDVARDLLYVVGDFTEADGESIDQVGAWDGNNWTNLNSGISGTLYDAVLFEGNLIVCGSFLQNSAFQTIGIWDGSNWSFDNPFSGTLSGITALEVVGDSLWLAGYYDGFPGRVHYLASYDGSMFRQQAFLDLNTWRVDGRIETICEFQGKIYIGGNIKEVTSPYVFQPVLELKQQNILSAVPGLDNVVYDLEVVNDEMLAGGKFFDSQNSPTFGLAAFDGADWEVLIDASIHAPNANQGIGHIEMIKNDDGLIVVGGLVNSSPFIIGTFGANILTYNRVNDSTAMLDGAGLMDSVVRAYTEFQGDVYVGGSFESTGQLGDTSKYVVYFDKNVNSIPDLPAVRDLKSYPNPAENSTVIELENMENEGSVVLYNLSGQLVKEIPIEGAERIEVNRNELPDGLYIYNVVSNGQRIGQGKIWFK